MESVHLPVFSGEFLPSLALMALGWLHLSFNKKEESVLISIRMPQSLLKGLKQKAKIQGKAYQALLKEILKKAI